MAIDYQKIYQQQQKTMAKTNTPASSVSNNSPVPQGSSLFSSVAHFANSAAKVAGKIAVGIAKPLASTAIQAPRAFVAGLAGLAGDKETEARFSKPLDVPILGTVKGLSANPDDSSRYGTATSGEMLGQAAEVGASLIGGGAAADVAGQTAKGALLQAAKTGAVQGAKAGALTGFAGGVEKDNANLKSVAGSTIAGAATGAALGGAIPAIAGGIKGASTLIGKTKAMVKDVKNGAVQEALSGIDTHTLNVLDPTRAVPKEALAKVESEGKKIVNSEAQGQIETSFNKYLKQARRAAVNSAEETPLETAGKKAMEALDIFGKKLNKQGELKQRALEEAGNEVVSTAHAKKTLIDGLRDVVGADIVPELDEAGKVVNYTVKNAEGRVSRISLDPSDQKLVKDVYALIDNLDDQDTVFRVDGTVDAIQDVLYKRKAMTAVPVNGQTEGVLKRAVGSLNSEVKRVAGKTYTKSNDKYAYFVDLRDKLNKALGQEGSKGGSLMKRVFSPTDGGTKHLFGQIKDLTGVDLVREATLAKQAMEVAGDTRQRNLLESLNLAGSVPTSPGGIIQSGLNYGLKKAKEALADKETVIKSVLDKAKNKAAK